jgi:hypothetical protein
MQRRIVYTVLTAIVIALALGLRSHSSEAAASAGSTIALNADSSIVSSLNLTVGQRVAFELTVTNNTRKRIEIRFPNGKTHDFVVLDAAGREVWRWSEGKMFTQVLQNKSVEPGQSITFSESWKNPDASGTFTAVALLWSRNYPIEQRALLVIPERR